MMFAVYVVLAAITGAAAFAKHSTYPVLLTIAYAAIVGIGGRVWVVRGGVRPRGGGAIIWVTLCVMLAIANAGLYPRTRLVEARSSAPDALIEPARRLVSGVHPYAQRLAGDTPISPGPGWIAVHAPLT